MIGAATANGREPAAIAELELTEPLRDLVLAPRWRWARVLLCLRGEPVGELCARLREGRVSAAELADAIAQQHGRALCEHLLRAALESPALGEPAGWRIDELLRRAAAAPRTRAPQSLPSLSVAVCTRDRSALLADCLASLVRLEYPGALEILVIDNAPRSDVSERLLRERFPALRYVREPRPGLDWARNRAIAEARGELLAYTDDDAVVDPGWARALGRSFVEHPDVMAVTGLVLPHALETPAQALFELYGGFSRGLRRRWFRAQPAPGEPRALHHGAGVLGTGANMAFRRELFARIGGFDPALDVGTQTAGGGDLELLFRVVQEGYTLLYEPAARIRHQHRRQRAELDRQIESWGSGFIAYIARSCEAYPGERLRFARLLQWWSVQWIARRAALGLLRASRYSPRLALAELRGALRGVGCYRRARTRADELLREFAAEQPSPFAGGTPAARRAAGARAPRPRARVQTREVELGLPLEPLTDVAELAAVRLVARWHGRPLLSACVASGGDALSVTRIRQALAEALVGQLYGREHWQWQRAVQELRAALLGAAPPGDPHPPLTASASVSVVIASRDRPESLRRCLAALTRLKFEGELEILVVDNHPASGLTPPVLAEFPQVRLLREARRGLSRARNAGIAASRGEIVVVTDDDVTVPAEWLGALLAPFSRPEVMIVTGLVLPEQLDTPAQELFERYGGLGRGWQRFEVDERWLAAFRAWSAAPTWSLGATANAAFRAALFRDRRVGGFDEALGAGTPTGCSEDTYLFYRALRAGHTLVYEPAAFVWHRHRRSPRELRRQLYGYSKGHVAYLLTTWLRDGEPGARRRLLRELPSWHARQLRAWLGSQLPDPLRRWLGGGEPFPLALILAQIGGSLLGPWALWRSRRRLRR